MGYRVVREDGDARPEHDDIEAAPRHIFERCRPFTMASLERSYALHKAVEYVVRYNVPGAFVECGVWRGGSAMIAALSFMQFKDVSRDLFLYDTFAGMVEPDVRDVDTRGRSAREQWLAERREGYNNWCYASLDEVKGNLASTGYPADLLHYVPGDIEKTIPETVPDSISILRLDTDWYSSTMHELQHLYPRLSAGGVIIVDDYGYWRGARAATDEFFSAHSETKVFWSRVDNDARVGVKLPSTL